MLISKIWKNYPGIEVTCVIPWRIYSILYECLILTLLLKWVLFVDTFQLGQCVVGTNNQQLVLREIQFRKHIQNLWLNVLLHLKNETTMLTLQTKSYNSTSIYLIKNGYWKITIQLNDAKDYNLYPPYKKRKIKSFFHVPMKEIINMLFLP